MVNKQGLWFLTLFSLILVLGVYYITMPNEVFSTSNEIPTNETKEETKTTVSETNYITALKIELDEKREALTKEYESTINSKTTTTEEKNSAYEAIKTITSTKGIEESLEQKIKKQYNLDSFIKLENEKIEIVLQESKHDVTLANNIMRTVQEEFKNAMTISVKFS